MLFETIYADLERGLDLIPALAGGFTLEQARRRPAPGSWSALEVICHLYDEEREDFREHLDMILNRPNDQWHSIDPEGWVTARKYNERDLQDMLGQFADERRQSLAWLKGLSAPNWESKVVTPPGFEIRAGDMAASWAAHDNLHMRQLVELRRVRVEEIIAPFDIRYAGDW